MNDDKLAEAIAQDLFDQFPVETSKYHQLIRQSVLGIVKALPEGLSKEQYVEEVRKALNVVSHGALEVNY